MDPGEWLFDGTLVLALLGLAVRILRVSDLFQAVVLFITWGLLLALAWARLHAPDISLAEAAVGAGITGVLLLDTLRQIAGPKYHVPARPLRWLGAVQLLLSLILVIGVTEFADHPRGLTGAVATRLGESGVIHPVTAVLLNFRAYDTWLDLGVLVLAVIGASTLSGEPGRRDVRPHQSGQIWVVGWLVRIIVPLMVLAAGYLLWLGKYAAGGAFQAGVVLGAAGVLLHLSRADVFDRINAGQWRVLFLAGFAAFALVGAVTLLIGRALLEYPPALAGSVILGLEAIAAVSIGATLVGLFRSI